MNTDKKKELAVIRVGSVKKFAKFSLKKSSVKTNVSQKAVNEMVEQINLLCKKAFQFSFFECQKQKRKTILVQDIKVGLLYSQSLFIPSLLEELEYKIKKLKDEVVEFESSRNDLFEENE